MKWIVACSLLVSSVLSAESDKPATSENSAKFDVNSVIAQPIADLVQPAIADGYAGPPLLVFTESEEAQGHVRKGFALIHASWDFEAYRHFAAAVKADPQCLMAYCGMVLSLTSPQHEFHAQRARAYNRMLTLAEFKADGEFYYPENERMYAVGVAELIVNGMGNGVRVFRQLAKDYPNDLQAQLFATYLSRGGYNDLGNPRVSQREAIATFKQLAEQHPNEPMVLNFLVMAQAEAPHQAVDFKRDVLPAAQKLVELSEGKAPTWQSLLGYVAWRSGEAQVAEAAFRKSIELFKQWKHDNKVDYADCEGLIRAQLFLATLLYEQGQLKAASALVDEVNGFEMAKGREFSLGALTQKWQGELMPFKMLLEAEKNKQALAALPKPSTTDKRKMDPYSAILLSYQFYATSLQAVDAGEMSDARKAYGKLSSLLADMQKMRAQVSQSYEFNEFLRALNSLVILHKELTAITSDNDGLAYNWYKSAIDVQEPNSRLLPPDILYPMEYRLGRNQLKIGHKAEAKTWFKKALARRPLYQKAQEQLDALAGE